jgi:asparagine synthase (glutamine-hydrolysing)
MGVQFGRWNFDGKPVEQAYIAKVRQVLAPYCRNGCTSYSKASVTVLHGAFHETKESELETQPHVSSFGTVIAWDGRLDNRTELIRELGDVQEISTTDVELVAASYQRWGTACLAKLIGDWALSIWSHNLVILAKDFVGTRQLYYCIESSCLTWSTVLDPLLMLGERRFEIDEEYIAGYLSTLPETHLTPFVGIRAVPAGSFVELRPGRCSTHTYWHFDSSKEIKFKTDAEYEEQFRLLFAQAVVRRLRSSSPILAELSGGMDSSSIVCMADHLLMEGKATCPRLDTISYYNDAEPNWNERPYFELVERKRGRTGHHLDVGLTEGFLQPAEDTIFCALPGADRLAVEAAKSFDHCLRASQGRIVLSGIGGDEFLGGVPSSVSQVQDLFVSLHWVRMVRELGKWALLHRRSWVHAFIESVEEFLPQTVRRLYTRPRIPPWLRKSFVKRNEGIFWIDITRIQLMRGRPSFQANAKTLDHLKRQLNCCHLSPLCDVRVVYPYFDRDLLTFLFAIPREQLVRPGQRRSLMRRALSGIVPDEILSRRRKAYVARQPLVMIDSALPHIGKLLQGSVSNSLTWINPELLSLATSAATKGQSEHHRALIATLKLELWVRQLLLNDCVAAPENEFHNRSGGSRSPEPVGTARFTATRSEPAKARSSIDHMEVNVPMTDQSEAPEKEFNPSQG